MQKGELMERNKGGRPAKSDEEAKRFPLSLRTTKELREQLEDAASYSGRSLAQEVEHRLGASFQKEASATTRQTGMLLDAINIIASVIEAQTGKHWHEDPPTYAALRMAIEKLISKNQPPMAPGELEANLRFIARTNAATAVRDRALEAVHSYEAQHPELPTYDNFSGLRQVPKPSGLFGSVKPQIEPAVIEEHDRLIAAVTAANDELRAIIAEERDALQPFDDTRDAHRDLGNAIAEMVIPSFRIIPKKG